MAAERTAHVASRRHDRRSAVARIDDLRVHRGAAVDGMRTAEIENSQRSSAFGTVLLHEMLREVCDIYEPIAENKNIDLRV